MGVNTHTWFSNVTIQHLHSSYSAEFACLLSSSFTEQGYLELTEIGKVSVLAFPFFRNPKTFIHQLCHFHLVTQLFQWQPHCNQSNLQLIQGFLEFLSQFCFIAKHTASLALPPLQNCSLQLVTPAVGLLLLFFFSGGVSSSSSQLYPSCYLSHGFLLSIHSVNISRGHNVLQKREQNGCTILPRGAPETRETGMNQINTGNKGGLAMAVHDGALGQGAIREDRWV